MPEDAGKKRFIKDFLKDIQSGTGFIDDIRIERIVRLPGSDGEGSTARSISGRKVSTITELLEDDLKHTFDEGYFTFRFVAAKVGGGKTSLLTYLQQLTETQQTYENHSIVVKFQLSDIPRSGSQSFMDKLYSHVIADTFYQLLHNTNLSKSIKNVAERILQEYFDNNDIAQIKAVKKLHPFRSKFKKYIRENIDGLEEFFFYVISEVSSVDKMFSFVYLTDELDALDKFPNDIQETRLLFKELIRRAFQEFKSKIRLLIYLVGTSENVKSFIYGDSVIESLVGKFVINLSKGYTHEFTLIKAKIDARIQGAYKGYKNFNIAWQEIKNIRLNPANTLREFCQEYASKMLEIHEKYFQEASEQIFEGNSRDLVEAQCRQKWESYLNKSAYSLSAVSTTNVLEGHAFDCYVELLHNGKAVARAFGEAKNYELLSGHLQTFEKWLEDVNFNPSASDGNPSDLAFMIAPSCPSLLQRKLELQNIEFIQADKVIEPIIKPNPSPLPPLLPNTTAVNINTADKVSLIKVFKGTGIKKTTIDKLITRRQSQRYTDINELSSDLKFTPAVKAKLQQKIDKGQIYFG